MAARTTTKNASGKGIDATLPQMSYPTFDWGGVFEGWARGFIRKNFWRVSKLLGDEEDALQECALVFIRCKNKYEGVISEPKHMMALFKTSVCHHWHIIALKNEPETRLPDLESDADIVMHHDNLAVALAECSDELRQLTFAILNSPAEFLAIVLHDMDPIGINRRIRRLFRITMAPNRDVLAELQAMPSILKAIR